MPFQSEYEFEKTKRLMAQEQIKEWIKRAKSDGLSREHIEFLQHKYKKSFDEQEKARAFANREMDVRNVG